MYKSDGGKKQVPNSYGALSSGSVAYNYATTPAARTIVGRPDHVVINPLAGAGTYTFLYATTASNGGVTITEFETDKAQTGSISMTDQHESIRLDINPVAWDYGHVNTAGVTGEVTFVYSKQDK
tara:strand:- start:267 stop:638 length:372 start_codon:yes stop_codon:yes gene_type:complete